jgi:putative tryptophan/tyrosine transport system substrate-binding protein
MKRREFIRLIGGATAWPLAAYAQQPSGPIPQIVYLGALSPTTLDPRQIEQFKAGLAENGLIDGQNIKVDFLWGEGSSERLRQQAADLAQRSLSVIVTAGPQPVRALLEAKVKSPIVFAILNDPIGDGFIQSLARPGGNMTGLSMSGSDLENKRLEILKDAVPTLTKVMLLHDPSMGPTGLKDLRPGARTLGIEVLVTDTGDVDKIKEAFAGAEAQGVNGVATMASPFFNFHRRQLIELSSRYRLPSIWESVCSGRRTALIWSELSRHVPPVRRLCRQNHQGRQP